MQNFGNVECCNYSYAGRIYYAGSNNFLIFVDECCVCGKAICEIKSKAADGSYITTVRRSGKAAEKLFEKYAFKKTDYNYKTFSGTRTNEYFFSNIYGQIYNGNGVKIAPQEKFLNMSRFEINSILNSRFYKSSKLK